VISGKSADRDTARAEREARRIRRALAPHTQTRKSRKARETPSATNTETPNTIITNNSMAPTNEELAAQFALMSTEMKDLRTARETDAAKFAQEKLELTQAYTDRIRVLELKLNDTRGHSIFEEHMIPVPDLSQSIPQNLITTDLKIFKGTEPPFVHIQTFRDQMTIKGVKKSEWTRLFPLSLDVAPANWFYMWNPKNDKTWEVVSRKFVDHYGDNFDIQKTIRNLEILVMEEKEGFTKFLGRWRTEAAQLPNKPREMELVDKFLDNLWSPYFEKMRYANITTFEQARQLGIKIENDIRVGILPKTTARGYQGSTSKNVGNISSESVNVLEVLQAPKKAQREFTPISLSYTDAFDRFEKLGFLSSIGPTPDPEKKPAHWRANEYCKFHKGNGHTTENCYRLKHKIQDLIEEGTIPIPNNKKNPLSSNAIFIDDENWINCSELITSDDFEVNGIWNSDDDDEEYIAVPIRKSKGNKSSSGPNYHSVAHTYQDKASSKKQGKGRPKSPAKLFKPTASTTVVLNDPSSDTSTVVQNNPSTVVQNNPSMVVQNNPSTTVQDGPSTVVQNGPSTTVLNGPSVNSTSTITMGSTSVTIPGPPLTQITPFEVKR